jgi:lipopolysaccharide export system protein LptA
VVIVQGEMRLSAPRVFVTYAEAQGQIRLLEATGGVTLVSGVDAAEAQRADYNIEKGVVVMSGDVLLTQGGTALTSQSMTIDLGKGTAALAGRVKTVLKAQPAQE